MSEFTTPPQPLSRQEREEQFNQSANNFRATVVEFFIRKHCFSAEFNWMFFEYNPDNLYGSQGLMPNKKEVAVIVSSPAERRAPLLRFLTKESDAHAEHSQWLIQDSMLDEANKARYRHYLKDEDDDPKDKKLEVPDFWLRGGKLCRSGFILSNKTVTAEQLPVKHPFWRRRQLSSDTDLNDRQYALGICMLAFEEAAREVPRAASSGLV